MSHMLFEILVDEAFKKTSLLSHSKQNFLWRWLYKILRSYFIQKHPSKYFCIYLSPIRNLHTKKKTQISNTYFITLTNLAFQYERKNLLWGFKNEKNILTNFTFKIYFIRLYIYIIIFKIFILYI
jgi:hypothetical protein